VNELDDAELRELRLLLQMLDSIDSWITDAGTDGMAGEWRVRDGSPLSTDDRRAHPYQVSNRAWMAIVVAVDFLHCLRRSLAQQVHVGSRSVLLHPYAQMGLLRGAVENASCAVWLLGPANRLERVSNRLALEWYELRPGYALRQLAESQVPRTKEKREQQLIELLLAARSPQDLSAVAQADEAAVSAARKALKDLSYVKIVQGAGALTPALGSTVSEATWRMCSAFAHGDTTATLGLLSTDSTSESRPGITTLQISSNVRLMRHATRVACRLTDQAFGLLHSRTRAPFDS
jgi:hypothetical protein